MGTKTVKKAQTSRKKAGVLMHISSLPSPYGIGTMGKAAYEFADRMAAAGLKIWQVLPLGPTGYGDSPYQSFSTFAGNPYFIDLDLLVEEELLDREELPPVRESKNVNYGELYEERFRTLALSFEHAKKKQEIITARDAFIETHPEIKEYALFMVLKKHLGGGWQEWEEPYRMHETEAMKAAETEWKEELEYYEYIQYLFFEQWKKLKAYVNDKGLEIMGDMPIYVAPDSSDVWAFSDMFQLDANRRPTLVAGVPPDYFCADGQLWGNPLYDWNKMEKDKYSWWKRRIEAASEMFDILRMDHFIGFANYYAIPAGSPNARQGEWIDGPGMKLFRSLKRAVPQLKYVAEDLGVVNEKVEKLVADSGFPSMKVLEFAWAGDDSNPHLPHHVGENFVLYTGTHDNEPVNAWWEHASDYEKNRMISYALHRSGCMAPNPREEKEKSEQKWQQMVQKAMETVDAADTLVRMAYQSKADLVMVPLQDYLGLGKDSRMNCPGMTGYWTWRAQPELLDEKLEQYIAGLVRDYDRA